MNKDSEKNEKMPLSSNKIREELLAKIKEVNPSLVSENGINKDKFDQIFKKDFSEDENSYFGLNFLGKNEALESLHIPSKGTLKPSFEKSVNFDTTSNLFIEGDNLEVLKLLQNSYFKKVKTIYIDPPYNTGKEFIYRDNFHQSLKDYLVLTGQIDEDGTKNIEKIDASGRKHSNWLRMMYPRLSKAYNLLRNDGVIFVSIDDNELANLKLLLNEIFGEENFVETFIWQKNFAPKNDAKYFSTSHDYILCYAKNKELFIPGRLKRTSKHNKDYKNPDNDPRGPWTSTGLEATTPSDKDIYDIKSPDGTIHTPTKGRSWKFSKTGMDELIKDNRVYFGKDNKSKPRKKTFLSDMGDVVPQSIILYKGTDYDEKAKKEILVTTGFSSQDGTQELKKYFDNAVVFDFPKPSSLIKRLIEYSGAKDEDLVLDFFAGSGSTGEAVFKTNIDNEFNLKFILIQLQEKVDLNKAAYKLGFKNITEITNERLRKAGDYYLELNKNLDTGFKNFILDKSNFKIWDELNENTDSLEEQLELFKDNILESTLDIDVVYEIFLKSGYELSASIQKVTYKKYCVYTTEDNKFVITTEKKLTKDFLDFCLSLKPDVIKCLDVGFNNNDVLKANFSLLCKNSNIIFEVI
jgi:adenine-specific DNA-methyltransferase